MTKMHRTAAAIALCAAAGLGAASAAWADPSDVYLSDSDAAQHAILNESVSLGQAITAAQTEIGGKAIAAKLEPTRGTYSYAVVVIKDDGSRHEAWVDPHSGDVTLTDPYYGKMDSADENGVGSAGQMN